LYTNLYVVLFIIETIKIDFGRLPEWNCPIPDTDTKSVAVHNEITTVKSSTDIIATSQSSIKEVNIIFRILSIPIGKLMVNEYIIFFR